MYFAKIKTTIVTSSFIFSSLISAGAYEDYTKQVDQPPLVQKSIRQYENEFGLIFSSYCTSIHMGETIAKESLEDLVVSFLKNYPESKDELLNFPSILHASDIKYADALCTFISWFNKAVNRK